MNRLLRWLLGRPRRSGRTLGTAVGHLAALAVALALLVWLGQSLRQARRQADQPDAPVATEPGASASEMSAAAAPAVPAPARASIDELKQAITSKNIFRPTNLPKPASFAGPTPPTMPDDLGPKPLKRPFTVLGFTESEEGPRVTLGFEKPSDTIQYPVGAVIEGMIEIVEIQTPYIRCDHGGVLVRIDQGETSNDAFERLMGMSSDYYLIGTQDDVALFFFNGEGYRNIEVGDVLGDGVVIRIERGQVILRQNNGELRTIKPTTPPKS